MNDPDNLHQCLARETLENTRGLIFWVRPDGTFPWVNPAVCVALGYTAAEFDDLRASDILADYAPDERLKLRREISTGGALACAPRWCARTAPPSPSNPTTKSSPSTG